MTPRAEERRSGKERRGGADRRTHVNRSRRSKVSAAAGTLVALSSYAAAVVSAKYNVPLEITSPIVGGIFAFAAQVYNKFVLPWLD